MSALVSDTSPDWQICQYPISLSERTIKTSQGIGVSQDRHAGAVAAVQRVTSRPLKCKFSEEKKRMKEVIVICACVFC